MKKIRLTIILWGTIPALGLLFIIHFYSCKKDKGISQPKYFSVSFWTDKDGYPIEVYIIQHIGPHINPIPIGTLNTYTNGQVTNCNTPNTLTKIIEMDSHYYEDAMYYRGYQAHLKPPFYYSEKDWYGGENYLENSCNIAKINRDTTLKKISFWTNNSTHFQNNNYLGVKLGWLNGSYRYAGKIYKSFSSEPQCGADSTFNAIFTKTEFIYYYIYKNFDSLIYSGSYTVTDSTNVKILIP